jgi:nucleotide-binding universal stress UspA family protein
LLAGDTGALHEAGAMDRTLLARQTCVWDMLRHHAEAYLEAQAISLRTDGLDVDIHVQIGAPADTIVEAAEQRDADLIVMATHGYTGFKRWTLGSVTDKVVQATPTPVLVVPGTRVAPAGEPKLKRIMLPLDGSEFARQALPLASELATCANAELLLFQAVSPTVPLYSGKLLPADILAELRDTATEELRAVAAALRPTGITVAKAVVNGYAAEEIVAAAAQHQVDLIVMATHGYGGIKRWALGSVADKVLHAAPAPLLLVHARPGEA